MVLQATCPSCEEKWWKGKVCDGVLVLGSLLPGMLGHALHDTLAIVT